MEEREERYFSAALDKAIFANDIVECFRLLDQNEGLGYVDRDGNSVLHSAAMRNSIFCKVLIERGLDPNASNSSEGETPLHLVFIGHWLDAFDIAQQSYEDEDVELTDTLRELDIHDPSLRNLRDLLLRNSRIGENIALISLLEGGADVNAKTRDRATPLVKAAMNDASRSCIAALLQYGANPFLKDVQPCCALDILDAWNIGNAKYTRWTMICIAIMSASHKRVGKRSSLALLPADLLRELCYSVLRCLE